MDKQLQTYYVKIKSLDPNYRFERFSILIGKSLEGFPTVEDTEGNAGLPGHP
ncbi:hypothetical protein PHLCEN_2v11797 [Hermanssonia centrifuga]|uniref:Uncharacterized protein n=1 Tax=Hermanssonia centrifuga TaxID=98765 RepID=A0A2R6NJ07_9APHY|nr:hypothetical protein PHLCEN_2v11797 [Hermanssonia centrifuga]